MGKKITLPLRLLLNAEPFGFGPTAAIASFFPYLKTQFKEIAYIGEKHTLDLQVSLPYDRIYNLADMDESAVMDCMQEYDVFLTATDFAMAQKAKQADLQVCIYDPLTWYWAEAHPAVLRCDLYLPQGFIGVQENLPSCDGVIRMVSPIVPEELPQRTNEVVLINLGGLQNPYW